MNLRGENPRGKEFVTVKGWLNFGNSVKKHGQNLPFSNADISVIQCETLETEVENFGVINRKTKYRLVSHYDYTISLAHLRMQVNNKKN